MVSSGAFWVAISYRLAAWFTGIGSTCGVEIYWRSFRHFGNYNYSLRKTVGKKMATIGQKLIKIAQTSRCFYTFSSESVKRVIPKITSWKSRGARAPVPHSWRRQWERCTDWLLSKAFLQSDNVLYLLCSSTSLHCSVVSKTKMLRPRRRLVGDRSCHKTNYSQTPRLGSLLGSQTPRLAWIRGVDPDKKVGGTTKYCIVHQCTQRMNIRRLKHER